MAISKVVYGGNTLLDLTGDTVTASALASGYTAHGADGESITGSMAVQHLYSGSGTPSSSTGITGDVYIRVQSVSSGDTVTLTPSASYSTYSGSLSNMLDGSTSTYWWSGSAQSTGAYVQFSFSAPVSVTAFQAQTSSNTSDCIKSGNVLQYTTDGSTWTQCGTFSGSTTTTISGLSLSGVKAMRIYASSSSTNWLCISEVTITYTYTPTITLETTVYKRSASGWAAITSSSDLDGTAIAT